jgi:hypothetical protein
MATSMSIANNRWINPRQIRSFILRLPLCTRLLLLVMVGFWVGSVLLPWEREWASLTPSEIGLASSTSRTFSSSSEAADCAAGTRVDRVCACAASTVTYGQCEPYCIYRMRTGAS